MINFITSHILFSFSINIIFLIIFIFLNLMVPIYISRCNNFNLEIPIKITIINFLFFYIYLFFEKYFGSDGYSVYKSGVDKLSELYCFEYGGCVREVLLTKIALTFRDLKINYLNSILFLNLLSCITFLLFYLKNSKLYIFKNFNIFLIFFVLSSSGMIFWGNSFLKDNFIILAISLFLVAINENKINFKILAVSILICLLIRPLPGYFILISVLSYYLVDIFIKDKIKFQKIFPVFVIVFFIITNFVLDQYSIKFSANIFGDIYDKVKMFSEHYKSPHFANALLTYGQPDQNFFSKIFYYYFMPLTISSKLLLIISIQNFFSLIFLTIFFTLILFRFTLFLKFLRKLKYENIFFLYLILYNVIVPLASYNSGIDLRQKWMSLVIFYYLIAKFISYWIENIQKKE